MSLKNHTTVKWTKFGEAECDKGWFIRKEQLEDTGDDNFPLGNYFMFYCNFLIFFVLFVVLQKKIVFTGGFF